MIREASHESWNPLHVQQQPHVSFIFNSISEKGTSVCKIGGNILWGSCSHWLHVQIWFAMLKSQWITMIETIYWIMEIGPPLLCRLPLQLWISSVLPNCAYSVFKELEWFQASIFAELKLETVAITYVFPLSMGNALVILYLKAMLLKPPFRTL